MLFYLDIHSSYTKKKVKDFIHKHGGEVSDVLSPDISLIVSDNETNEKATRPFNIDSSNAVVTRSYRLLQKALELNRKDNIENKIQLFADKNGINIYSSEKFLALAKEGLIFDKEKYVDSRNVQGSSQKETELKNPAPVVNITKNSVQIRKMAERCTNSVHRFFNKNTKALPKSPTPNAEQRLQHNFLKIEDDSRQVRPLHKVNVFQKLVFCLCQRDVFHSAHVEKIESSHSSSFCHLKSNCKDSFKYINLSGYCEICYCNFPCLWNHITGDMHKESVSNTSYSQIDDLFSQFPTIDEFLQKHCPMTNVSGAGKGNVPLSGETSASSESDIEALDFEAVTNVLLHSDSSSRFQDNHEMDLFNTSCSDEELYSKSDFHGTTGIRKEPLNVGESAVQPCENNPTLSVPNRQIKLPPLNYQLLKRFSSEFLPGIIRKRLEDVTIYLERSVEYSTIQFHTDVPARDVSPVDQNVYLVLGNLKIDILSIGKLYCETVKKCFLSLKESYPNLIRHSKNMTNGKEVKSSKEIDVTLNHSLRPSLIEKLLKAKRDLKPDFISNGRLFDKFPDRVCSGSIIQENPCGNSFPFDYISESYNHRIHDFTESKKTGQNNKSDSREMNNTKKLLLQENCLRTHTSDLRYTLRPNILTDVSIEIEPITDVSKNCKSVSEMSGQNTLKNATNEKMANGETQVVTKIKNDEIENKAYEMAKPEDENEKPVLEGCGQIVPEKIIEEKDNTEKDITIETEEEEKSNYYLLKNLDSEELNNQCKYRKRLIVRIKKVLLDDNYDNENCSYICISSKPTSQSKLVSQNLDTSDNKLTLSKPKSRRQKKQNSNAKVKRSSFTTNSLSKKSDLNIWSSSLLGHYFQTRSYRRLDNLVMRKCRIRSSSEHSTPESNKRYLIYIVNKLKSRIVMAFHRKTCPAFPLVDELSTGDTKRKFDHQAAIEEETKSSLKDSDGEYLSSETGSIKAERNYQLPNNVFPMQNSAYKTSRKLETRTNCSENWNIKANHALRMTLCRI